MISYIIDNVISYVDIHILYVISYITYSATMNYTTLYCARSKQLERSSRSSTKLPQIASKQRISQGKVHEPSCCAYQERTSPVSNRIVWRAYTSSHPILVHAGPACSGAVHYARQPFGDRCNAEGRVDPPQR